MGMFYGKEKFVDYFKTAPISGVAQFRTLWKVSHISILFSHTPLIPN